MSNQTISWNVKKIVQAIHQFAIHEDMKQLDRQKIEMLFWAVDRKQLRSYGRYFTQSTYVVPTSYPTTTLVHELLFHLDDPDDINTKYFNDTVQFNADGDCDVHTDDTDYLSEVEMQVIDDVCSYFADYTYEELRELAGRYPESFPENLQENREVDIALFFADPDDIHDDFFAVDPVIFAAARETFEEIEQLSKDIGINLHQRLW